MSIYTEIIFALDHPDVLHSSAEYRRMLRTVLELPRDFKNDVEAMAWADENPLGTGHVIEKNTRVASYFGKKVKK